MFARLRGTFLAALRGLFRVPSGENDTGVAEAPSGEGDDSDVIAEIERAAERLKYSPETDDADVATVIGALDAPDREVRLLAIRTLGGLPPSSASDATEAVDPLIEFLDGDLGVRIAAAQALARLAEADPAAVAAEAPRLAGYLDDFRVWVSNNVAAALGAAARSSPETVAALAFEYVDDERYVTQRNAIRVLHSAADVDPEAVEPVVPRLVALLNRGRRVPPELVETLAAVAADYPGALASAVPAFVSAAEERSGAPATAAVRALAELGCATPSAARPAVPTLVEHLAEERSDHHEVVIEALVTIAQHHPDERDTMVDVLADVHGTDRLRVARALAATGTEAGTAVAEAAVGGSSLERYLP